MRPLTKHVPFLRATLPIAQGLTAEFRQRFTLTIPHAVRESFGPIEVNDVLRILGTRHPSLLASIDVPCPR